MKVQFVFLFLIPIFWGCSSGEKAQSIIDASISAHGFDQFVDRTISFDFRERGYSVSFKKEEKVYTRLFENEGLGAVKDVLKNSLEFTRYVNDTLVIVDEEWSKKYIGSINSVLYFFQLPYGLNDPAAIKKSIGQSFINDETYNKVKVTFRQEGGGEDHQDIFIYWFNDKSKLLDYLAYSYETDGGGVRFRQAINRQKTGEFVFQDYVNYEPINPNLELENLDKAFESGKLKELSRIENKNIKVD